MAETENPSINLQASQPDAMESQKTDETSAPEEPFDEDEFVNLPNDSYAMFFLSRNGDFAFFYSLYVFFLKLGLFAIVATDTIANEEAPESPNPMFLAAQFLLLPVAVGLQTDLTESLALVANVKYCPETCRKVANNRDATRAKFIASLLFRGIDGTASLLVNIVVMLKSHTVLGLFLNFAALHFLQSIDDVAVELAANGFVGDSLQSIAAQVHDFRLPRRPSHDKMRDLDSLMFLFTLVVVNIVWIVQVTAF